MKHLYIRIPDELHACVKESAADKGISMNQLVIDALAVRLDSVSLLAIVDGSERSEISFVIQKSEWERVERYLAESKGVI